MNTIVEIQGKDGKPKIHEFKEYFTKANPAGNLGLLIMAFLWISLTTGSTALSFVLVVGFFAIHVRTVHSEKRTLAEFLEKSTVDGRPARQVWNINDKGGLAREDIMAVIGWLFSFYLMNYLCNDLRLNNYQSGFIGAMYFSILGTAHLYLKAHRRHLTYDKPLEDVED